VKNYGHLTIAMINLFFAEQKEFIEHGCNRFIGSSLQESIHTFLKLSVPLTEINLARF